LRTLPARADTDQDSQAASLLGFPDHAASDHRRLSSGSESSWTDTGDIGDQPGDDHDPVRLQLPQDLELELLAGVQKRQPRLQKKVRIRDPSPQRYGRSQSLPRTIDKESIEIPQIKPPRPSRAERCIGAIMSGRSGSIHGLTGKALLYDKPQRLLTSNDCSVHANMTCKVISPAYSSLLACFYLATTKVLCRASSRTIYLANSRVWDLMKISLLTWHPL
jgi:hypothetical protein